MPRKDKQARRSYYAAHNRKRRVEHRKRTGKNLRTDLPKPNDFGATTIDLLAPDCLQKITDLAARSVPHTLIAKALGMTLPAFKKHCEQHEEFQAALDQGHALEELWAVGRLREMADSDGKQAVLATLAILNSRHGWRGERQNGAPQVVINLPPPSTPTEYARLVEHTYAQPALPVPGDDK